MFGNRAKISAEELAYMKEQLDNDRGFFENVNAKSKLIEADFDELEKSRQLEESSLKQLNDNANNVVEFSKDSMDAISALNDSFTECVKAAADNLTSLESAAKAIATQHEETVVLLSHKKADSYIHIDVEFGEGEGKIPVDSIAKRAEAYKPKEKVTYKMIKEYIEAKYGFKVHTAYIAEVKRNLGLPMYDAPNAVEELKQPRKHPTPEKVEAIKDALRYFAVI